ncbi:MAG: hypothetical protein ACM3PY_06255 [Omnitrophica WOR_2 bacterium]
MALQKFGSIYLDLDKITYVQKISPEIQPASAPGSEQARSIRIGFEHGEVTLYEDEPGYEEFIHWLDNQVK